MIRWLIPNDYGVALYDDGTIMATFTIQMDGNAWHIRRGTNGDWKRFDTLKTALRNLCGERYAELVGDM